MVVSEGNNELYDYDVSDNDDLIAYPNIPTSPKWEQNIIQAARELDGNPSDYRRTRSQFESALSVKDPFFVDKCFLMIEYDPHTYEYSCEYPIWKTTMKEEFHLLQKNDTWDLVILPSRGKLVKCKWLFKTKFSADGSPLKYKSRLVAK